MTDTGGGIDARCRTRSSGIHHRGLGGEIDTGPGSTFELINAEIVSYEGDNGMTGKRIDIADGTDQA